MSRKIAYSGRVGMMQEAQAQAFAWQGKGFETGHRFLSDAVGSHRLSVVILKL
jgi:hypothetical protein